MYRQRYRREVDVVLSLLRSLSYPMTIHESEILSQFVSMEDTACAKRSHGSRRIRVRAVDPTDGYGDRRIGKRESTGRSLSLPFTGVCHCWQKTAGTTR